jgi:hypothetical protein
MASNPVRWHLNFARMTKSHRPQRVSQVVALTICSTSLLSSVTMDAGHGNVKSFSVFGTVAIVCCTRCVRLIEDKED